MVVKLNCVQQSLQFNPYISCKLYNGHPLYCELPLIIAPNPIPYRDHNWYKILTQNGRWQDHFYNLKCKQVYYDTFSMILFLKLELKLWIHD